MRWALASLGVGQPFEPVGFWIGQSWSEIGRELRDRLNYQNLEVLFSDGGPGIQESLLEEGMQHQRCVWHGKRDFSYLLYADGLKKDEQAPWVQKLKAIPAMNLSKANLESLRPEDLPQVHKLAEKTKQDFEELLSLLENERYPRAYTYLENLWHYITTFFDWWLKNKEWIPLNTNAIETAFSQINNRIKRVGRRWTDQGLLNWLKVTMHKIFYTHTWEDLWKQYLKLNPTFTLVSISTNYQWV